MRVSQEEKDQSHERIVASAARLMRERGTEGASVADVMRDAGLTHGGFYRHFGTKEEMLAVALQSAFDQTVAELDRRLDRQLGEQAPAAAVAGFRAFYLSRGHLERPGVGCPVAAVGADIGRGPAALKGAFGEGVRRMVAALARGMKGSAEARRAHAMRELALLVGALVVARASDPATAREMLLACQSPAKPHSA